MAKKGALKSVYIVNDDDLRVNGGRWLLQSGPAIRVRGFTADTLGDRKVTGGDALPVYVLGENDIRANGGQFLLKGGQPISVTSAIATARGVIQGKAIPVWPVDDDGNFDSNFAGFLPTQIANLELWVAADLELSLADGNPVALWPDQSGSGNDLVQGVGANQPLFRTGIINGLPVVRGDGINDNIRIVNAAMTQPRHAFLVAVYNVFGASDRLFDGSALFAGSFFGLLPNLMRLNAGASITTGGETPLTFDIYGVLINGAASEIRINGAVEAAGNAGATNPGGLTLFADGALGNLANADIAEFISYNAVLTAAQVAQVETYLSNKYAIAIP